MKEQGNAFKNLEAIVDTGKTLVKTHGLRGLAYLPFCHVGYYSHQDYVGTPGCEDTVASEDKLPKGAVKSKTLLEGQLESEVPVRNKGEDWIFDVHSHRPLASIHGGWPVTGKRLPDSKHLTQEQAVIRARQEFTGK